MKLLTAIAVVLLSLIFDGFGVSKELGIRVADTPNVAVVEQSPERKPKQCALSDACGMIRVCSTRSQRVVPSHGPKPNNGVGRFVGLHRQGIQFIKTHYRGRLWLSAIPLRRVASCDYYVIALRHIIR